MNHHSFEVKMKKILLPIGCLILLFILGACTSDKSSSPSEFKKQYFEGKSNNWYVKMEYETDSFMRYVISYIGEGKKPVNFKYEIYQPQNFPTSGDGEFKNEDEFEINENCGGQCGSLPKSIPIQIQWDGKKEKVVIKNNK
ncbi:hypothetical protein AN964_17000 [Heyndrickxia shackletonii]|uniref:Uncharacterized protein n=1 Tax=Heyndrickxia shackletonii TaxID=157838 RepID=A0A0Q3X0A9_9BACI|nr:hypothetical protein [Heyndrickxia shackletonii]KQL55034.1 hypothetical protein AN964_17000 [Heyndrickxia shackletonii]MBB2479715.1 hypothetical protein [Bacillus sp. APMAM]NEZ01460.1 hypothetical protein [Heyndrickxia shackletonii]RTZ55978.1 hypothetical protein EKO25_09595 [Bacillus sp. SAJ1]